jgi:DNA-directed RNA polymerase specialized sigma24 family protein
MWAVMAASPGCPRRTGNQRLWDAATRAGGNARFDPGEEDARAGRVDDLDQIESLWGALTQAERRCVRASYLEDLGNVGAAERMGLSHSSVKELCRRAVHKMRRAAGVSESVT